MIEKNKYNYYFYSLLTIVVIVLLFVANSLSISYKEALNVFENTSILTYITKTSIFIFGQNDIALRLPFIILYVLSSILMYKMTEGYFKYEKDRLISIILFMLLPGVLSASLLVNSAIIVTFCTLLYLYIYYVKKNHSYILLGLFLFIDNSFAILFLALAFYAYREKEKKLLQITSLLFIASMFIYGFSTDGKPKGFLVDTFGTYASIFSPLLFIYFFYTIYRVGTKEKPSLVWYISTTALLLSLLFSFRQRIYIEDFAPYVVIFLPYMIKGFFHSYRVRLKEFRKNYNIVVFLVVIMLALNVLLTIVNKPLYVYLANPKKHFVYKYHFAKEIANELKSKNINNIFSEDDELILRLKFYGIEKGNKYYISEDKINEFDELIDIKYKHIKILNLYIKKI
ncbi:glycosyltransferase family 39 protein [Poseidonibacter sp.]|uniref:glycosyltransferase family 39 protein n=1 Tax=Poseidonibacter sp. TaxID=2321188 RepID=UPI003C714CC4